MRGQFCCAKGEERCSYKPCTLFVGLANIRVGQFAIIVARRADLGAGDVAVDHSRLFVDGEVFTLRLGSLKAGLLEGGHDSQLEYKSWTKGTHSRGTGMCPYMYSGLQQPWLSVWLQTRRALPGNDTRFISARRNPHGAVGWDKESGPGGALLGPSTRLHPSMAE